MKKTIVSLLIVVIIFNFICINFSNAEIADTTSGIEAMDQTRVDSILNNGQAMDADGNKTDLNMTPSATGTMVSIITRQINWIPMILQLGLTYMAHEGGIVDVGEYSVEGFSAYSGFAGMVITIEKIIFGRYFILNVDYSINSDNFDDKVSSGYIDVPLYNQGLAKGLIDLRENAYMWHYILRIIALIISLLCLIYVGIRMAISTVASEQAKYKKMLMGWFESVLIMVLLPYIITIILNANKVLMDWAITIKDTLITSGDKSFEANILESVYGFLQTKGGLTVAAYSITYWLLVFIQLKFFFIYLKRIFVIAFLIIIAPLITVTYPIDKIGDGQAQAFAAWLNEFIVTTFIQSLHAFTYMVFMFLAGNIAEATPLIGIAFLYALPKMEKIVKVIFNFKGSSVMKDIADTLKKKG